VVVSDVRDDDDDPERAWDLWLEEWVPGVLLADELGRKQLAEGLALAVELVVPGQPMSHAARERWWGAWLRVEADHTLDLDVDDDRVQLAAKLARLVPAAPVKDELGRWRVFGTRR
jgi:hypothetical protein